MNRFEYRDYDGYIEQCIIGNLMLHYGELKHRMAEICADDFYSPEGRKIFSALAERPSNGEVYDITLLYEEYQDVLLKPWLQSAFALSGMPSQFGSQLSALKEMAYNRRVKKRLSEMALRQGRVEISEIEALAEDERNNVHIRSYVDKAQKNLEDFISGIGLEKERIRLGFPTLDKFLGGLRVPSVMIIGAYPSVGKTALALNIAANQEAPVIFFSLEMSAEMIYERRISAAEKIDYGLFSTGQFDRQRLAAVTAGAEKLRGSSFYVFDDIYDIEGQSAVIANIRPKLVIVDYIQKVRTGKRLENRRTEIEYLSGMYKQIANYNKCSILLLSQISRGEREKPTMASLKESGALEADGDYVGILNRPYVLCKDKPEIKPEEAQLLIDKNKFGGTGVLDLHFDVKRQQFYEVDKKLGSIYTGDSPFD